ncbi:penicillin-binding protein 1B [Hahella sp. CR1]|uniref:penicillin-binding protein 1B n=1 Tax=Hahella sp. CR1 TaxID=2992807 RepID=UPI00244200AA|nr:penicillin-binding protein 1B [Hahella sp. CR1]MDG9667190.1 penicillin-binding protein 1B [Hahella sp. CR1]
MSKPKTARKPANKRPGKKKTAPKRRILSILFKVTLVLSVLLVIWTIYLDATVREKFEGKRWQLPAQVFARPMEFFPGQNYTRGQVEEELKSLGYRRTDRPGQPGTYSMSSSALEVYSRSFKFPDGDQKAQKFRLDFDGQGVSRVSAGGTDTNWSRLEPVVIGGIYPAQHEDRLLVSLKEVPDSLKKALVAVEDKNFYSHYGVSPLSIMRATWVNIRAGRVVQGGSTLTQQLVKNFYLSSDQTIWRKFNEAIMAVLLEWHYEKDEILEAYCNEIFLGQAGARAIHGFGMASQFYFGVPVQDLTPEKSALLVAIVKGASYYNPRRHPERAQKRRDLVLQMMADGGVISNEQSIGFKNRPLGVVTQPRYSDSLYPAFMDLVRQQLDKDYREEDLQSEGLRIFTTLDPLIQSQAESALSKTVKGLERNKANQGLQGALVTTALDSGEVVALVGGKDAQFAGFNRALEAKRQIGSLIKPVIALTALQEKDKYTLATPIKDEAFSIKFENGDVWAPQNYDKQTHGEVSLQHALAHSLNLANVRLGLELGVPAVLDQVRKLGVETDAAPYPSVLLGALNLTPLQVAHLYQNLASTGFDTPLRAIRAVTKPDGELLTRYPFDTHQVVDPAATYLLQYAMFDVMREGTGRRVYQRFPEDYSVAGKTGTTDDYRDSWFVGFNGQYQTTVWLGKDDNSVTRLTGASGALEVWMNLYQRLPQVSFVPTTPETVEWVWVDSATGKKSDEGCDGSVAMPFQRGSAPVEEVVCVGRDNALQRWLRSWWDG